MKFFIIYKLNIDVLNFVSRINKFNCYKLNEIIGYMLN